MERPDPGSAELTPAPDPVRRRRLLPLLLALVLLTELGGIGALVRDRRSADNREDDRQAALQAARVQAVNLTTISYQSADRDLARIVAAATGTLKTQFDAQRRTFPDVLRKEKSVSVGNVLSAGVTSQSDAAVEALVAVDATVKNATSGTSGVLKHYRMDMRLVRIGGRWLVSQVAFAGVPQ
ncbi:MAG: Mce-associated rane protein [Actinomycetota bacterium]|nr:Mce-associated rane protein [Actinomycetota bacterium]